MDMGSGSSSPNSMDPVAHCIVLVTTHEYLRLEDIGDQDPVVCMVRVFLWQQLCNYVVNI